MIVKDCGLRDHKWESIQVPRAERKCVFCGKNAAENFAEATGKRQKLFAEIGEAREARKADAKSVKSGRVPSASTVEPASEDAGGAS